MQPYERLLGQIVCEHGVTSEVHHVRVHAIEVVIKEGIQDLGITHHKLSGETRRLAVADQ
jgi:hypothetical protein